MQPQPDGQADQASRAPKLRAPGPRALLRLLRSLWRYRGQLEEHHQAWMREVATTLHAVITATLLGRVALRGWRLVIRFFGFVALVNAILTTLLLWSLGAGWWSALAATPTTVLAAFAGWYWFTWGAMLRLLDEHTDKEAEVDLRKVPSRLAELAREGATLASVPVGMTRDLVLVERDVADSLRPPASVD